MKYLLIITCIFLFASCRPLMMATVGIETPRVRKEKRTLKMLKRNNMVTKDVYYMDKQTFIDLKNKKYKPGIDEGFRFLQIRCYDKEGQLIMQWASCEGLLSDLQTLRSPIPKNYNGLDTTLSLETDLLQYCDYNGNKGVAKIHDNIDYSFVVFYATWTRGMQKRQHIFREINNFIDNNPDKKIAVYKINYDNVPFWDTKVKAKFNINKN